MNIPLNPQRGFRDIYPSDKIYQEYIFKALKSVALLCGFESYDGPILEDIQIYLNKTSAELIEKQTFQVKDKKEKTLILRPEMTPTLARMIAKKAGELTFPLRLFNLGLRFRYEAPQKGREREFYQADFDLVGSSDTLADAEILSCAVRIFQTLGASSKDFVLYVNSRLFMEQKLEEIGVKEDELKMVLNLIDKRDKLSETEFSQLLAEAGLDLPAIEDLQSLLKSTFTEESNPYFTQLFSYLKRYGIDSYCQINPNIVRGLDYYTGLVFEVKEKEGKMRSLLGGGRYDNLISSYDKSANIPGVGFATSDVVLWEFLRDKNLLPQLNSNTSQVLVTVFGEELIANCIEITQLFRSNNISSELYPSTNKRLDKQLKYADKKGIPFVVILGPEEVQKGTLKLKDMRSGTQQELKKEEIIAIIKTA